MQDITKGDLIIYEDENDKIEIEAFLYNETIWLPLNKIAELFEKDKSTISEHIKNIFDEQELYKDSTVGKFPTVQTEGTRKVNRNIDYYNLDMIIAVRIQDKFKKSNKIQTMGNRSFKIIYYKRIQYKQRKTKKS